MRMTVVVRRRDNAVKKNLTLRERAWVLALRCALISPALVVVLGWTNAAVGATATFTVAATGTGTLSYQWYRGSSAITGANAASYTTPAVTALDNGAKFSVTVTNSGVTVASTPVLLTAQASTGLLLAGSPLAFGLLFMRRRAR
jgi:hypothetical protein